MKNAAAAVHAAVRTCFHAVHSRRYRRQILASASMMKNENAE